MAFYPQIAAEGSIDQANMMNEAASVPEGYVDLGRAGGGAFNELIGPIYVKRTDKGPMVAIRIVDKHLNGRGIAHGGMLSSLVDVALGVALALPWQWLAIPLSQQLPSI